MAQLPSLASLTLDLPPSCIAFCPSKPQFFVVGTYLLHPKEQQGAGAKNSPAAAGDGDDEADGSIQQEGESEAEGKQPLSSAVRTGSLILFRLDEDEDGEMMWLDRGLFGSRMFWQVVTKSTEDAILDVQWAPKADVLGDLLGVATSTGRLVFYRLDPHGDGDLVLSSTITVSDPSVLVLSLAWHPWRAHVIGLTLSDGSVCLCESTEGELWSQDAVIHQTTIHHHTLEAWTLAFSGSNSTNVFSGGDDCVLQSSSINDHNERQLQWQDRKLHDAGVTAILPLTSELAVTGSYDDHIRLTHLPPSGRRQVLAEANMGGGVWRLKTLSSTTSLPSPEGDEPEITSLVILASCMHAGTRVVRLRKGGNNKAWDFEVLGKFEEHGSMNYGADFQPGSKGAAGWRVVSVSFYDRLMCLWRVQVET